MFILLWRLVLTPSTCHIIPGNPEMLLCEVLLCYFVSSPQLTFYIFQFHGDGLFLSCKQTKVKYIENILILLILYFLMSSFSSIAMEGILQTIFVVID